jgi:hypothetical protein
MPAPSCADLPGGCCAASSPRHRSLPSKLQKCPTGTKAVPLGLTEDRTAFGRFQDSANREKGDQSTIHNMLRNRAALGEFQKRRKLNGKETPVGEPVPNYIRQSLMRIFFEQPKELGSKNLAGG